MNLKKHNTPYKKITTKDRRKVTKNIQLYLIKVTKNILNLELKKVSDIDILVPCISDTIDASIIKAAKN